MRIATWNVNSIRVRLERVVAWLEAQRPDVLCLQETKVPAKDFPTDAFATLGYEAVLVGQRAYNGVAILSRTPLTDVETRLPGDDEDDHARFVAATTAGIRVASVYVPNGEAVGSPKFAYKLAWLERLRAWVVDRLGLARPAVACGDYNVAPAPIDVHDPRAWDGHVLFSDPERAALHRLLDAGLVDVVRTLHPTTPCFSWWDYRMLSFPKNRGLRIDHLLATPALAARATAAGVDREARKGRQPSDHAPVWAEFAAA